MYIAVMLVWSAAVAYFKNLSATKEITKAGFKIIEDKRSDLKQITDFIKDYWYIFIPGYNVYESIKVLTTPKSLYAQ